MSVKTSLEVVRRSGKVVFGFFVRCVDLFRPTPYPGCSGFAEDSQSMRSDWRGVCVLSSKRKSDRT